MTVDDILNSFSEQQRLLLYEFVGTVVLTADSGDFIDMRKILSMSDTFGACAIFDSFNEIQKKLAYVILAQAIFDACVSDLKLLPELKEEEKNV